MDHLPPDRFHMAVRAGGAEVGPFPTVRARPVSSWEGEPSAFDPDLTPRPGGGHGHGAGRECCCNCSDEGNFFHDVSFR